MKRDTHQSEIRKDSSLEGSSTPPSSVSEPSSKEVILLVSGLLILSLGIGGMWTLSEDQSLHANSTKAVDIKQVSKAFQPTEAIASLDKETAAQPSSATLVSFEEETLPPGVTTSPNEADVYFGFDQATLSEDAQIVIQEKVDNFKDDQGWRITVQGHTDPKGSDTYNQALGSRRAKAVEAYLMAQGIQESSIYTESLGSQASICMEDSEECFQQNRRAHIMVATDQLSVSAEAPLVTETTDSEAEAPLVTETTDSEAETPVAMDTTASEPENVVTVESDVSDLPLSEEESSTTTALLSEPVEEMPSSESTATVESRP